MFETSWQDIVLSVGNVTFLVALLPSVFSKNKPSFWTSLATATALSVFAFVFYTLGFWFAMFTSGLTALGWWILFLQKITSK